MKDIKGCSDEEQPFVWKPNDMIRISRYASLLGALLLFVAMVGCKDGKRIVEPKEGPAHLVIPQKAYDFGPLSFDAGVVEHEFMIVNDGSEDLAVTDAYNSCSCTTTEIPDHPIRPGHGAKVKVYLDVSHLTRGDFIRFVTINSNGGSVEIELSGTLND